MSGGGSITSGMWPVTYEEPVRYAPQASDYSAHRMTVPLGDDGVACDCGAGFEGVVDLEMHQHRYRHPGLG